MKTAVIIIVLLAGMFIGGTLAAWIFFGILTFVGFVGLIESIPVLKWIVYRTSGLFDVIIFVLTIIATVKLGVTITASLSIAGLLFTFVYRPYINYKKQQLKNK